MKMNQITTVILAAAGICSVSLVSAENYGRGLSLNPGGGYYSFDSEHNIDDDSFPSVGIEYRFTDALALELTYIDGETVEERNDLATFDVQQLRLDGNYYFNPDRKLQPYLSAGLGMFELTHVEKNILKEDTVADAGVGVRYFFNKHFSLRSDLRAINNIDSGYTDSMFNVGLNLLLGGNTVSSTGDIDLVQGENLNQDADLDGIVDNQDQCPDTMAGLATDEQGCPADMDNDGVADYNDDCLDTMKGLMVDENGCAIPVEQTVSMDLNVNFPFDGSDLPPEFYSDVKELATFLKLYGDSVVTIEGHADSVGPETYNLKLSERRARVVRDILVKDFEIQRDRLRFVGYGEEKPVATNETEEGRSKNRRAATVVTATRKPKLDQKSTDLK